MALAQVLFHSSIRIEDGKVLYFDPYKIDTARNDADIIYITHDHYDHYSEEDIKKVMKDGTVIVVPKPLEKKAAKLTGDKERVVSVKPEMSFEAGGVKAEAVYSYNVGKIFHPKVSGWVGYVVALGGTRYYIAGDTDKNKDIENIKCDVAFVPVGGHYTMDAKEAAELINIIKPEKAIPTHYGVVAGSPEDGDTFAQNVDSGIRVEIQLKF